MEANDSYLHRVRRVDVLAFLIREGWWQIHADNNNNQLWRKTPQDALSEVWVAPTDEGIDYAVGKLAVPLLEARVRELEEESRNG